MKHNCEQKFSHLLSTIIEVSSALQSFEIPILIDYLQTLHSFHQTGAYSFEGLKYHQADTTGTNYIDSIHCPYSQKHVIGKHGFDRNGRQRYICKECGRTFLATTCTSVSYLNQETQVWRNFILGMLHQDTIATLADRCNISPSTAMHWRLRVFQAIEALNINRRLSGIIVADDTRIRYNLSGNHSDEFIMPRNSRHRGQANSQKTSQRYSVSILCAIDNEYHTFSKIVGFGSPSGKRLVEGFRDRLLVDAHTILVTDGARSFAAVVNAYGIQHWNKRKTKRKGSKRVPDTSDKYHIQAVNSLHSRLKRFFAVYKGVATRYLSGYLQLFDYLENNKNVEKDQLCNEILLCMLRLPKLTQEELERRFVAPVSNGPETEIWEIKIPKKEQRIYLDWYNKIPVKDIAQRYRIKRRKIYTIRDKVRKYGVHDKIVENANNRKLRKPIIRPLKPISDRNWELFLYRYKEGHTLKETAEKFGLSITRVDAIVKDILKRPEAKSVKRKKQPTPVPVQHIVDNSQSIYREYRFLRQGGMSNSDIYHCLSQKYKCSSDHISHLILDARHADAFAEYKYRCLPEKRQLPEEEYYLFLQKRNEEIYDTVRQQIKESPQLTQAHILKTLAPQYNISYDRIVAIFYNPQKSLHVYDAFLQRKALKRQGQTLAPAPTRPSLTP